MSNEKISKSKAEQIISEGKSTLIDVRDEDEFESSHMPGTVCLPVSKIGELCEENLPNKDETILLYCASGNRSAMDAKILQEKGYKKIYSFGIFT